MLDLIRTTAFSFYVSMNENLYDCKFHLIVTLIITFTQLAATFLLPLAVLCLWTPSTPPCCVEKNPSDQPRCSSIHHLSRTAWLAVRTRCSWGGGWTGREESCLSGQVGSQDRDTEPSGKVGQCLLKHMCTSFSHTNISILSGSISGNIISLKTYFSRGYNITAQCVTYYCTLNRI